jgi:hypothetical protein
LPEADLEFLGRQLALVLEGQRQTNTRLAAIESDMVAVKATLAETTTRDLMLRMLRSIEGQIEVAGTRTCWRDLDT